MTMFMLQTLGLVLVIFILGYFIGKVIKRIYCKYKESKSTTVHSTQGSAVDTTEVNDTSFMDTADQLASRDLD